MVVGDADQSIYAFRGANIRNILDFEQDFPDATSILLEQNYRSTQTILTAANAVIGHNQGRKEKRLWSDAGDGDRIVGYVADDEHDEARFVSDEIDKLTDDGQRAGDVAVFYRTNAQSRVFEEVFIRTGQPYKVVGGVRFYERREVRDALAYLRMLVNADDSVSLRRILNVPKRGIGDRAVACVNELSERERITFWEALRRAEEAPGLATRSLTNIRGFVALVEELQEMVDGRRARRRRPRHRARQVRLPRRARGLRRPAGRDPRRQPRRARRRGPRVLRRPRRRARPPTPPTSTPTWSPPACADFLERVALVADTDQIPDDDGGQGVVTLMTLHTAKGLEFPTVFLTGLEDGVFPHSRSLGDRPELEEERRLAYVGITRARERLYISRAVVRSAWGAPSPQPGQPLPRRAARRPRRLAPHRGRPDPAGAAPTSPRRPRPTAAASASPPPPAAATSPPPPPAPTPQAKSIRNRVVPSPRPRRPRHPRLLRPRHRRRPSTAPATRPSPPSTSATARSSGCCSASRPIEKL